MALNKRMIDALVNAGGADQRKVQWYTELAGFGVRVYPSGKKTFVLSYRAGRKRLMSMGAYGQHTVSASAARGGELTRLVWRSRCQRV